MGSPQPTFEAEGAAWTSSAAYQAERKDVRLPGLDLQVLALDCLRLPIPAGGKLGSGGRPSRGRGLGTSEAVGDRRACLLPVVAAALSVSEAALPSPGELRPSSWIWVHPCAPLA